MYHAIAYGYRHIDTAQAYGNEAGVGRGIARALEEGLVTRDELFITTKIQGEIKDHSAALASIAESLNKLGLDYLDLVIIHSPQPWDEFRADSNFDKENLEVWRALEEAQSAGTVRSIGVSNFLKSDLQNILDHGSVPPAVNQVLAHVTNIPTDLIDFAKSHHIKTEAYSPIAHGAALNIPELKEMAERYGVTVPQLCIRYTLQLGLISPPKSAINEHIDSNADVEFEISDADMETLNNLPPLENYGEDGFFPVFDKAAANRKA
ncbi:aldo/keto reductase [Corynebacterium diphtheriae]|uniref:aldo/keto reductase n=1 Tax=Corynebacterium diphtheriae TaxID=1717 RepID=UPI000245B021|nr:aldo/keto reductase [Corynebacterium diphtheriae]MBN4651250.1 aldo/keto reductase [Corynebacterium diphtheriae bv. mitis]AEX42898.1 aldo/keto reductase family oxidoreductase [Corynebacterium diphtheriae 31A]AEX49702.1 aldo/keto reductase family oxidoreductase [Corynebacterium diphtheriae BH8]MBN4653533.1 aldo/keto reductase [Corynebacterium diphtheriae bv. mitis]OIR65035.1 2,5-diketo-D-gluconic acid reductase [Corynebacterium diphtheriae]